MFRRDPLAKFINTRFPPIAIEQQRQEVITSAAAALAALPEPNVAFRVAIADLEKTLNTEPLQKLGVTRIRLHGDNELLRIEVDFTRRFTDAGPGASAQSNALLRKFAPELTGKALVYTSITSAATA